MGPRIPEFPIELVKDDLDGRESDQGDEVERDRQK